MLQKRARRCPTKWTRESSSRVPEVETVTCHPEQCWKFATATATATARGGHSRPHFTLPLHLTGRSIHPHICQPNNQLISSRPPSIPVSSFPLTCLSPTLIHLNPLIPHNPLIPPTLFHPSTMSATSSPRSTRSHDRSASRTANTPSLPSKFRIPPTPPRIHRRLRMTIEEDGLLLRPLNDDNGSDDQGVLIEWGLKKAIRTSNVDSLTTDRLENATPTKKTINSAAASIVIGGILGRSHLWETSYLLFFLPPPDVPPNKLFPSTQERQFPEELPSVTPLGSAEDELRRFYVASSGEEASPAIRRERAESSATVKQGYAGLYRRDTISGPGKNGDPNPQDGSQGEFHTLKNVYALPLRKEEAAEFIKKLNMAVTKVGCEACCALGRRVESLTTFIHRAKQKQNSRQTLHHPHQKLTAKVLDNPLVRRLQQILLEGFL
jgi:hypothetical protein